MFNTAFLAEVSFYNYQERNKEILDSKGVNRGISGGIIWLLENREIGLRGMYFFTDSSLQENWNIALSYTWMM